MNIGYVSFKKRSNMNKNKQKEIVIDSVYFAQTHIMEQHEGN